MIWPTVITGAFLLVAATIGRRKLNDIHVLVNSSMKAALKEIADLNAQVATLKDELAKAEGTGEDA